MAVDLKLIPYIEIFLNFGIQSGASARVRGAAQVQIRMII